MKNVKTMMFAFGIMAATQATAQVRENREEAPKEKPTAESPKPQKANKKFAKIDANGDGYIVLDEMQKAKGKEAKDQQNRFRKMDANGDGRVTPEEFKNAKDDKEDVKTEKEKKEKVENPEKPVQKEKSTKPEGKEKGKKK